jgi:hypothetical protein
MPALSPVDEAGLLFLALPTDPRQAEWVAFPQLEIGASWSRLPCVLERARKASQLLGVNCQCVTIRCIRFRIGWPPMEKI